MYYVCFSENVLRKCFWKYLFANESFTALAKTLKYRYHFHLIPVSRKVSQFQFHSILSRFCTLKRISNANLQLAWLFIIVIWRLQIFLETRTKISIYYLAAPRPTLGRYRGDNLTLPMLITALDQFSMWRSPGALQRGWVPMPCPAPSEA